MTDEGNDVNVTLNTTLHLVLGRVDKLFGEIREGRKGRLLPRVTNVATHGLGKSLCPRSRTRQFLEDDWTCVLQNASSNRHPAHRLDPERGTFSIESR